MTNRIKLRLILRTSEKNGYSQAKDEGGAYLNLWYKYKDGTDNKGNVHVAARLNATEIKISLNGSLQNDYDIRGIRFDPPQDDIGVAEFSGSSVTLWDLAKIPGNVKYDVIVSPTGNPDQKFYCDPMIINDWGGDGYSLIQLFDPTTRWVASGEVFSCNEILDDDN